MKLLIPIMLAGCASTKPESYTVFYCDPVRLICKEFCEPDPTEPRVCYTHEVIIKED